MKIFRKTAVSILAGIATFAMVINFNACSEQSPFTPETSDTELTLGKRVLTTDNTVDAVPVTESAYPQSAAGIAEFSATRNEYNGVAITLPNGSVFYTVGGALTPPEGTVFGEPVKITFTAERDERNNELLFSFGPSGCQFSPAAEVKLSWKDLNIDTAPTLYYLESKRKRIEQLPDEIDLRGQWMIIKINHFSRYALAWSK
jgi:hypothetical protein